MNGGYIGVVGCSLGGEVVENVGSYGGYVAKYGILSFRGYGGRTGI